MLAIVPPIHAWPSARWQTSREISGVRRVFAGRVIICSVTLALLSDRTLKKGGCLGDVVSACFNVSSKIGSPPETVLAQAALDDLAPVAKRTEIRLRLDSRTQSRTSFRRTSHSQSVPQRWLGER